MRTSGGGKTARDILHHFRHSTLSIGELARVRQLVDDHGKSLILSYDQLVEQDGRDLDSEADGDPNAILELARDGRYTGVALYSEAAKQYWPRLEGGVPLIVRIDGKSGIPPQEQERGAVTGRVEEAIRLGAVAVGFTMNYGSKRQSDDLSHLVAVRRECERLGMPLMIWAQPRGEDVVQEGGPETSYALESAARMAVEMGAKIIKSSFPRAGAAEFPNASAVPVYYHDLERQLGELPEVESLQVRADRIVLAAQGVPVLFSGGSGVDDEDLLYLAEVCVKAGCLGFIFGRSIWKRERLKALETTERLKTLLHEAD